MSVEFGGIVRNAGLIDTKIDINIITPNLTRRVGFPIRDKPRFINIVSQTGHSRKFYKVIEEEFIKIGSAVNTVSI